jgi:hypothetical protein
MARAGGGGRAVSGWKKEACMVGTVENDVGYTFNGYHTESEAIYNESVVWTSLWLRIWCESRFP